jgi:hypothetical protein
MTPGQVGSWFINGALTARQSSSHRYIGGLAYSAQRVNATDLFALSAINGGSRSVGRIYGFDEWIVSKYFSVGYGLSYMWQDYVATDGLSALGLDDGEPRRRASVRALAAEQLAPDRRSWKRDGQHANGLCCQRTALPVVRRTAACADDRSRRVGRRARVAAYVVGVRTFYQT